MCLGLGWACSSLPFRRLACKLASGDSIEISCLPERGFGKARERNGFIWLTLIGQSIRFWPVRVWLWFDFRGRSRGSVLLFYQGRRWQCLGVTCRHKCACVIPVIRSHCSAPSTWIPSPDVDRVVRSHVDENKVVETHPHRTALPRNSLRYKPTTKRIPYPLPHISISNPAYRHPLPSFPPYISVNILTAATSSLPPAAYCTCQPSARKCEPLCGACVLEFFQNLAQHHSRGSESQLLVTTNSFSVGIANTVLEDSFFRCRLTATANLFFLRLRSRWRASSVCSWISVCVPGPQWHGARRSCKTLRFPTSFFLCASLR